VRNAPPFFFLIVLSILLFTIYGIYNNICIYEIHPFASPPPSRSEVKRTASSNCVVYFNSGNTYSQNVQALSAGWERRAADETSQRQSGCRMVSPFAESVLPVIRSSSATAAVHTAGERRRCFQIPDSLARPCNNLQGQTVETRNQAAIIMQSTVSRLSRTSFSMKITHPCFRNRSPCGLSSQSVISQLDNNLIGARDDYCS